VYFEKWSQSRKLSKKNPFSTEAFGLFKTLCLVAFQVLITDFATMKPMTEIKTLTFYD
jgi:hypothetical protein